jgi:hypothetical protein
MRTYASGFGSTPSVSVSLPAALMRSLKIQIRPLTAFVDCLKALTRKSSDGR